MEIRVPIYKNGTFNHFNIHEIYVAKGALSYSFGNCQLLGIECEIKQPEVSTGVFDKNNTLVFVNDILRDEYGRTGVVKLLNGSFKLEMLDTKQKLGFGSFSKKCTIIGNIYQTPE